MKANDSTLRGKNGLNAAPRQIDFDDEKWETFPETESLLEKIRNSPGENVKRSSLRSVTRHRIGGRVFYVKTYFHDATLFGPAKYFFKNPPSREEWALAPRLQELEIPVVPHLAHGERWNWRGLKTSTLITEGPLGFASLQTTNSSAAMQTALGKFIRRLHDCSVFHDDLHISNLLYSFEKNDFCLVDLDNMKIFSWSLRTEQRLDNLATLHRRLPLMPEFYAAYGSEGADCAEKVSELADRKVRAGIPKKLKLLFEKRSLFAVRKCGGLKWHVRVKECNEQLEFILRQPDEFLATRAQILKNGSRSTVGCSDALVVKRFNFKKVSTVIFDLVRDSRARHSFRTARHLELLKIATPRPIAYADVRRFGFIVRSYFIMEKIPGATYLWQRADRPRQIRNLAALIAKLHNEGFSHRDLKETNLVLSADCVPYLIDLDALRFPGRISDARAVVELARLAYGFARWGRIPLKERLLFLKEYCKGRRVQDWRWWWNEIAEKLALKHSSK